jgi:hypothetical protein
MNIEFTKEVNSSKVLKIYNKIYKLTRFITYFKWVAGILMFLGVIDTFLFDGPHKFTIWSNIIVWIPAIIFSFVFIVFHTLTGFKLSSLSKKYNIHPFRLKIMVDRILNK